MSQIEMCVCVKCKRAFTWKVRSTQSVSSGYQMNLCHVCRNQLRLSSGSAAGPEVELPVCQSVSEAMRSGPTWSYPHPGGETWRQSRAKIDTMTASYRRWSHQQEVVTWLREIGAAKNWVVLDTETTGSRTFSEAIEVTVISAQGQVVFSSLVNPTTEIEPLATSVHGLTRRHVKDAPRYPDIHAQLCYVLQDVIVIGYQVCFDIRLLVQTARCYEIDFPFLNVACLMYSYAKLRASQVGISRSAVCRLDVACEELGVPQPLLHRAQPDATAAHGLLQRMIEVYASS